MVSRETSRLGRLGADILALAQQPSQERAERYANRLDAHLTTLPDDAARSAFCAREEAKWEERYKDWARAIDGGTATKQELTYTAWDFLLTLAAISQRKARYGGRT